MEDTGSEIGPNVENSSLIKEDSVPNENDIATPNKCSSWCAKINVTIEPAIFAIFLASNLCDAVITNLIMSRTCEAELHINKTECNLLGSSTDEGQRVESLVQPYASVIITAKSLISLVIPAILSVFSGPWSDNNGRKILLLLPMLGLSMTLLSYASLSYFPHLKPAYFLLASLPFSFCGGYINLFSASYSYISDVSQEENRALRMGITEAALYVGSFIGIISSYHVFNLDKRYGYVITLSIGALISLAAFLYTICFVPESIRPRENTQSLKELFQIKFVKETFLTTFKRRENHGRCIICMSLIVMTTTIVAMEGESNLLYLFTRLRFGWDLQQYTTWLSVFIAAHFAGLILGCVILAKVFKLSDIVLVIASFLMKCVECVLYGLIPRKSPQWMYWAQLFGLLGGVCGPALRSVLSKTVPKEDVGKVFFLATSFESLSPLAFTPIYTTMYNFTFKFLPGAFFLLSAAINLLNFTLCCVIFFIQRRVTPETYARIAED